MMKGILAYFSGGFLLMCLILSLVFGYIVLKPFLFIFMIAFVLATLSYPAYSWILKLTKKRASLSSFLTCFLIIIILFVPAIILLGLLTQQSLEFYHLIEQKVKLGIFDQPVLPKLSSIQKQYLPFLKIDLEKMELGKEVASLVGRVSSYLVSYSASLLKNVASGTFKFFLMLFALYYFLKDGPDFLRWLMHISPLPSSYEREIFQRFRDISESAFFGTILTAVAQGILGGIGFLIVGLPAVLWAVAMAFFSLIPMVGTGLVWFPASIYLLLLEKYVAGIFLIVWGVVVIGLADNFIRPFLMKGKAELHPLLIFFSILGGVAAFGLFGILLGPLAISLCMVFLQVYAKEAKETLDELSQK